MADRSHHDNAVHRLAVVLLVLCAVLHYGWALFPPHLQAGVWNVLGSFVRVVLLGMVVWHVRSPFVLTLSGWWFIEEALVIGCNTAYMIDPWQREPGEAMCYSLLHFDLGKIGASVMAFLAYKTYKG